ncbi:Os02g0750950, partial [Oryza sativa Japonica Group]
KCSSPAQVVAGGEDTAALGEGEELVLAADPPLLPLEVAPHQRAEVIPAPATGPAPPPTRARREPSLVGQPVHHPRRKRRRFRRRHRRCRGEQQQQQRE